MSEGSKVGRCSSLLEQLGAENQWFQPPPSFRDETSEEWSQSPVILSPMPPPPLHFIMPLQRYGFWSAHFPAQWRLTATKQ
ncbi:hypothetical protein FKM82_012101 [Ascaphus truei]